MLGGDFQGKPIGYNITYYAAETEGDNNVVNVNYTTNITALSNLTVYTMYVINVSAVSSGGTGPANTVKARTGAKGTHVLKLLHLYHSPPVSKRKRKTDKSFLIILICQSMHASSFFLREFRTFKCFDTFLTVKGLGVSFVK